MHVLPPTPQSIERSLTILRAGGCVAHATETCYGFACDLTNPKAVERLFTIKQRPLDQPGSVLLTSVEQAKQYVEWPARAQELAEKYLPGPLTLVLPMHSNVPFPLFPIPVQHSIFNIQYSLGVRISSHPIAQALAAAFGKPLSTTSANLHGKPNPYSVADSTEQFRDAAAQPDLIIDSGSLPVAPPSTIIAIETDGSCRVLRRGALECKT